MARKDESSNYPESVVGPSVKIEGDLVSRGNLQIEGHVSGKVQTSSNLFAGENARLQASIEAQNATIAGIVEGDIKVSETLVILETGKVLGNIHCRSLGIREGAYFSGQCEMEHATDVNADNTEQE